MVEENKVKKDLMVLCLEFIEMMDNLKNQGIIDQNQYQQLVENKKRFLEDHGRDHVKQEKHR